MFVLERHFGHDRLRLVDVGARDGVDPRWAAFASVIEVVAFEPDEAECERLNREAGSLPYPARFLPQALGREAAQDVPFHVANWPVASSIYPPNEAFLRSFPEARALLATREVRRIATTTLDSASVEHGFGCDVLKLDVEGAELDVLRGGDAVLGKALVLEVEVELNPIFEGQPLYADVDAHLRERGWTLQGLRRTSWRRGARLDPAESGDGGQIVAADALYLSPAATGELELERELKLLVAMAAYRQADFVLARLRGGGVVARELSAVELRELEAVLAPAAGRRRALAAGRRDRVAGPGVLLARGGSRSRGLALRLLEARGERRDHVMVELGPAVAPQHGQRLVGAATGAVWAVAEHAFEGVGDGDDPCLDRDRVAAQAQRVSGAVHALVVGEDPRAQVAEAGRAQQPRSRSPGGCGSPPTPRRSAARTRTGSSRPRRCCRCRGARRPVGPAPPGRPRSRARAPWPRHSGRRSPSGARCAASRRSSASARIRSVVRFAAASPASSSGLAASAPTTSRL